MNSKPKKKITRIIIICVSVVFFVGCRPGVTKKTYENAVRDAFMFKYGQAVDIVNFKIENGRNIALVQLCDDRDLYIHISTDEHNEDLQDDYALAYLEHIIEKDIDSNVHYYYSNYYVHVEIQGLKRFPPDVDFRELSLDELMDYVDEEGSIDIFFYIDNASLSSAFPLKDNKEFVNDSVVSKKCTTIQTIQTSTDELEEIRNKYQYE